MTSDKTIISAGEPRKIETKNLRPIKNVLIAVDSDKYEDVVLAGSTLAEQLHADITLINVCPPPNLGSPEHGFIPPDYRKERLEKSEQLLNEVKTLMPTSANINCVIREGDPAEEIVEAAGIYDADLIIVGTHARGRIAQALIGSVAREVSRRAACPVMTAPPTSSATPAAHL